MLEELLEAAGSTVIAPPSTEPDSLSLADGLDALRAAGAAYEVAPGVGLLDYLWTHISALRTGEIASRLRDGVRQDQPLQAFILLYATEVRGPLLYTPGTSPIRAPQPIGRTTELEGPHLALAAIELTADGRADITAAFAKPIYQARRLLPVRCALDRDVLRALEHFQAAVDAHGVDCGISRVRPVEPIAPTRLILDMTAAGRHIGRVSLDIAPLGVALNRSAIDERSVDFVVCDRSWRDGSFTDWLRRIVRG